MTEKELFITVPGAFLPLTKSYHHSFTKTKQRTATAKRGPGISVLRFAIAVFVSLLLLPFLLITGRDKVKLNKIKSEDAADNQQLVPRF